MTQSLHPAAQKGFSLGAELYQQVRPSYPQEIAFWLQDRLKIDETSTVVDLGSGTGKFLPYLIQTGAKGRQWISNRQQSTANFDSREKALAK